MTLRDFNLRDTRAVVLDEGGLGGTGLVLRGATSLSLERFIIEGNDLIGIQFIDDPAEARDGVIRDNFIGLNLPVGFETPEDWMTRVDIKDNCCGDCQRQICNISSEEGFVPQAVDVIDEITRHK